MSVNAIVEKTGNVLSGKGVEYGLAVVGGLVVGMFDPLKTLIADVNIRAGAYILLGAVIFASVGGLAGTVFGGGLMLAGITVLANTYVAPQMAKMLVSNK